MFTFLCGLIGAGCLVYGFFNQLDGGTWMFAGLLLLGFAGYRLSRGGAGKGAASEAHTAMAALRYHHFCGKSGIAVDPERRIVHLIADDKYKTYSFDDIRKWSTNTQTGGVYVTGGFAAAAANVANAKRNAEASGLFIEVRDIDDPLWKIRFAGKNLPDYEKQLARWSEILRQHVNENVSANA